MLMKAKGLEMRQFLKGREISQSILKMKVFHRTENMGTRPRFNERGKNINFQK